MKIRVLIVDDEPWARKRIATLLKSEKDVVVVGQCVDGSQAIEKIIGHSPDLVFLDVQMPEANGFEVVEAIGAERMPLIIFATAYDKYALQAFDAHALDYLLKPFDEERFYKALNRVRKDIESHSHSPKALASLLDSLREGRQYLQRLAVKSGGRVTFLKSSEVDWFEASGNYVTLHVGREVHLLRTTMNSLEPKLDANQFVRIHRSVIVNLDRVQEIQPWFRGEQVAILNGGTRLTVGRGFRDRLTKLLRNTV
jgi:two-component system LytT family response regulator